MADAWPTVANVAEYQHGHMPMFFDTLCVNVKLKFSVAVLYGQAQSLAFSQARNNPQITRPLISAAEAQATQIIRDNFVQPTLNALGYNLTGFTIHWSAAL